MSAASNARSWAYTSPHPVQSCRGTAAPRPSTLRCHVSYGFPAATCQLSHNLQRCAAARQRQLNEGTSSAAACPSLCKTRASDILTKAATSSTTSSSSGPQNGITLQLVGSTTAQQPAAAARTPAAAAPQPSAFTHVRPARRPAAGVGTAGRPPPHTQRLARTAALLIPRDTSTCLTSTSSSISSEASIDLPDRPAAFPPTCRHLGRHQALVSTVLLTGVANRVLYKMVLVPLRDYNFFLAQMQNLGYLLVYFTALVARYRAGIVTDDMLRVNKRPFVLIGACEAVAQLLFMVGAARIPGTLLPVVNQTYLAWNMAFAALILGTRYSRSQVAGAIVVMLGVMVAALPPSVLHLGGGSAAAAAAGSAAAGGTPLQPLYVGICVACFAFPAIASCIKELLFRSAHAKLGQPLDIFVVNSFGSLVQAAFVVLLLPVTTALNGLPLSQLPAYLADGARVVMGHGGAAAGPGAPLPVLALALAYVVVNLAFNISILTLLRSVGTVATTLVGSCLVPLTIAAFTLPLPYLDASSMMPNFVPGVGLLMVGLATYNFNSWREAFATSPDVGTAS